MPIQTPMDNRLKALDLMQPPGMNNVGSTITAMQAAKQKADKAGQPLDLGELAQAATQQAGQKVLQAEQTAAQQQQGVQQLQLGQQQQNLEADLANREEAIKASVQTQEMTLRQLSARLAQELHEDTTQFKRDEIGRAYLNEKQLLDYAVLQAKSQEELQGFIQVQTQMHEKKLQMLKAAYQKIEQALKQVTDASMQNDRLQFDAEQQRQNQIAQEYLANAKRALEEKMAQEQREAAKAAAGWGVLSSAVQGAVVGGSTAGPWGALAGGAAGAIGGGIAYASQK